MQQHLDKPSGSATPIVGVIRLVLALSGVRTDLVDRSEQGIVAWATPIVREVAERVFPPRHMEPEDLEQEIWLGILQALKSYEPRRGSLRWWITRQGLQRAYDAVRWASRHEDEMAAAEISEVDHLLSDLSGNPEEIILRQRPRQRLAHYAAKLVQSASETAKTVLRELMVGTNGATPEQRLASLGLSPEQVDRARTELRALGFAALRQVIADNSLAFARHRRP